MHRPVRILGDKKASINANVGENWDECKVTWEKKIKENKHVKNKTKHTNSNIHRRTHKKEAKRTHTETQTDTKVHRYHNRHKEYDVGKINDKKNKYIKS